MMSQELGARECHGLRHQLESKKVNAACAMDRVEFLASTRQIQGQQLGVSWVSSSPDFMIFMGQP